TTYRWILGHEFADRPPEQWTWPYDVPGWVFTHRQLPVVPGAPIEFTSAAVTEVHQQMAAAAGDRNLWIVGGGDLAGQFADAGLLDEVIVSIAPVTLGAGAPLLPRRIELRLDDLGRNRDFVSAKFSVEKPNFPQNELSSNRRNADSAAGVSGRLLLIATTRRRPSALLNAAET